MIVGALDAVDLADNAVIFSTVEAGGVGKGGFIDINAATLSLIDGVQLQTITREASATQPAGRGDAGNVNVKVTGAVDIAGEKNGHPSGILSSVGTGTVGNGGNITIDSGSFSLRDGGALFASTSGQGNAGTITVNAAAKVTISGVSSDSNNGLFVNSFSRTGTAGDINVTSPRVTIDNSGILNAESTSGNGGNINLQTDLLVLRRGAKISTTAGITQAGGDGGNITINAPFIVAVPSENSDITANAFTGKGGRVNITAQGIFGIQARSRPTPFLSDITASSDRGVQGVVEINIPRVDQSLGLATLPAELLEASRLIATGCSVVGENEFKVTGRGGLPPNPGEPLSSDVVWEDTRLPAITANQQRQESVIATQPSTPATVPTVEATSSVFNDKGELTLTANALNIPWMTPATCHSSTSPSL